MKSIIITLFLILFTIQSYAQNTDYTSNELQKAFNVQCRIKLKGTFKLTHLTNDKSDQNEFMRLANLYSLQDDQYMSDMSKQYKDASNIVKEQHDQMLTDYEAFKEAEHAIVVAEQEIIDAAEQPAEENVLALSKAQDFESKAQDIIDSLNNGNDDQIKLFIEDSQNTIELPDLCKYKLSPKEIIDLGIRGHSLAKLWINSYEEGLVPSEIGELLTSEQLVTLSENGISYDSMPPLNIQQFSSFYMKALAAKDKVTIPCKQGDVQCLSKASQLERQEVVKKKLTDKNTDGTVIIDVDTADEDLGIAGIEDAEEKMAVKDYTIFSTVLYGQARDLITWLEFWVYTCSNGQPALENEYMVSANDERLTKYKQSQETTNLGMSLKNKLAELNPARRKLRKNKQVQKKLIKHHHQHKKY